MRQQQARAMAAEVLNCEGIDSDEGYEGELRRLSDHLQTLLPDMSEEWAVIQGEEPAGGALRPAILALTEGVVWQIGIEGPDQDCECRRRVTVAVFPPDEYGVLIGQEALAVSNPDRPQRLWRALAREKLRQLASVGPD